MGFEPSEPEQRQLLVAALAGGRITVADLWLKYFSLGGDAGEYEIEAYLQGLISLREIQRNLLAMAANELLPGNSGSHAPYSDEVNPEDGPPNHR